MSDATPTEDKDRLLKQEHEHYTDPESTIAPLKLYVCGPMTGFENFNYEMFNIAAADLRASGYEVENPADLEAENTSGAPQAWSWYMRRAITKLMLCNGMALLDGWENSRGAVIEVNLAHNLGYQIRHIDAWLTA